MENWLSLSRAGSDRATGYNMSNKIVRRGDTLFVGWLDTPLEPGLPARIQLGVCTSAMGTIATGARLRNVQLEKTIQLGEGIDNHCGPALALDHHHRLHAIIGAHHGPFLHRWSDNPADISSWSEAEPLGPADTYPSLAVDSKGTLHLAHRERGERWQLWYRRKRPGRAWEAPQSLAVSPTKGYNHFMQSIVVGPDDTLHLCFQFHYAESGQAIDCTGRAAAYLRSEDGGDTWFNESRRCDTLPLAISTIEPVCHYPNGGVRIGNQIVDAQNQPWLFTTLPDAAGGVLWQRTDAGWQRQDLSTAFGTLNLTGGRATSLSRDEAGRLHLAVATSPEGIATPWFDPKLELFHLLLDASGNPLSLTLMTGNDPGRAGWLPALEQYVWTRPSCTDGCWLLYTRGLNAGGIGGDNRNAMATDVFLGKV